MTSTEQAGRGWARRFNEEVWGERNLEAVDDLFAEDFVEHSSLSPEPPRGPDEVRASLRAMMTAFPDAAAELEDVVADGDRVAMRITATGTHEGEFMGIDPTGREIAVPVIAIERIVDGMAVEEWQVVDRLTILEQLGVVEGPPGADRE